MKAMTSNPDVCNRILETRLCEDMLRNLDTLSAETLSAPASNVNWNYVREQIVTLHHVLRNADRCARGAFRQIGAVEVMQKFLFLSDTRVSLLSQFVTKFRLIMQMYRSAFGGLPSRRPPCLRLGLGLGLGPPKMMLFPCPWAKWKTAKWETAKWETAKWTLSQSLNIVYDNCLYRFHVYIPMGRGGNANAM